MNKHYVIDPNGKRHTRNSQTRTYSHAVLVRFHDETWWRCAGWCGRPDLAEKKAAEYRYNGHEVRLPEAQLIKTKPRAAAAQTTETNTMTNGNIIRVTATTPDDEIEEMVKLANGAERVEAYNRVTGKAIKKFSTKAAGLKQTVRALVAERDRLATDDKEPAQETPNEERARVETGVTNDLADRLSKVAKRRHGGGAKHDPAKYRSAYVKEQLLAGRIDYDAIAKECQERFPNVKTERKHVTWYRWQLRKAGHAI